jgi:hypothetical protein
VLETVLPYLCEQDDKRIAISSRRDVTSKLGKFRCIDDLRTAIKHSYDKISYIFSRIEHIDPGIKSLRIKKTLTLMSFVLQIDKQESELEFSLPRFLTHTHTHALAYQL